MKTSNLYFFVLFIGAFAFISCQKEIDGLIDGTNPVIPVNQKPKVGTTWIYDYYTFNLMGGLATRQVVTHKATTEVTLGGEKWLKIMDTGADTLVYYLQTKAGGLYQYTNNSSNLFCKYPALLNETYNTFNEGVSEDFKVKGVNDTLPTGIGDIPANYYEGFHGTQIIDMIWYNDNAWIVRKTQYRNRSVLIPFFYKYYTFFLQSIIY